MYMYMYMYMEYDVGEDLDLMHVHVHDHIFFNTSKAKQGNTTAPETALFLSKSELPKWDSNPRHCVLCTNALTAKLGLN